MLREVARLVMGWSLYYETDNGEPRLKSPGGVTYRPDQLRFRRERDQIHAALDELEKQLIVQEAYYETNWSFWAVRKARLWLEWNPENRSWDDHATAMRA